MTGRTNFNTILIVDDSHTSRMVIRKAFQKAGYADSRYLEAEDGESALDLISSQKINLIVTDIRMPNMNGEELVQKLREDKKHMDIPVIVVSSSSNFALSTELQKQNVMGYTLKPVTPEKIINTVENIFDLQILEQNLFNALEDTFDELYKLNFDSNSFDDEVLDDFPVGNITSVDFVLPKKGRILLVCSTKLVKIISKQMRLNGLKCTSKDLEDCLKELTNILCGNFLIKYYGPDKQVLINLPKIEKTVLSDNENELLHEFGASIDGAPISIFLSINGLNKERKY